MAETVLVCVTGQSSSAHLIHRSAEIAREHDAKLLVLYVSGNGLNTMTNPGVVQALDDLYHLSSEVGAEMTMVHAQDARKAIHDFAREREVDRIVLGQSREGSSAFIANLMRSLPSVSFTIEAT